MNEQYGEPSRGPFAIRNELREIHRKLDKVCGPEHWESKLITPDNCGCSQLACNIVNNTFLSLDGFEAMRKQMAGTDYTDEQFGAELARIVDRELKAATSELGNAGCDKCGTFDRVEGSKLCSYCGGSCPSDEENACDGYLGDIDELDEDNHLEVAISSLNEAIDGAKDGLVSEDLARNALAAAYELKLEKTGIRS